MLSAKFFEAKFSDLSEAATVKHLGYQILDSEDDEFSCVVYITGGNVTLRDMSKAIWESDVGSSYIDTLLAVTTKDQLTLPPVKSCRTVTDGEMNVLSCSETY